MTSDTAKPHPTTAHPSGTTAEGAHSELTDAQLDAAAGGFGGGIGEDIGGGFATSLTKIKGHPWEEDPLGAYAKNIFHK